MLMSIIDADGAKRRRKNRLLRRTYQNKVCILYSLPEMKTTLLECFIKYFKLCSHSISQMNIHGHVIFIK